MDKSIRAYRFARWGIYILMTLHFVYYVVMYTQLGPNIDSTYRRVYTSALLKQFLLVSIIPGLEVLIYWFIRHRLYKPLWVRMHLLMLWLALFFFPVAFALAYAFNMANANNQTAATTYNIMATIQTYAFWGSIVIGHLFFIATIVKSFSKPPSPTDATDTPHILDEFNR